MPISFLFFLQVTKTELEKLKSSYRQLIKEVNSAKEKYKEALTKGRYIMAIKILFRFGLIPKTFEHDKIYRSNTIGGHSTGQLSEQQKEGLYMPP